MVATSSYITPFSKSILSNFLMVKNVSIFYLRRDVYVAAVKALIAHDVLQSALQPLTKKKGKYC